eukprot:scaffold22868_cov67-Skeletonema_dohrnii-CCMP3373.AAC.1
MGDAPLLGVLVWEAIFCGRGSGNLVESRAPEANDPSPCMGDGGGEESQMAVHGYLGRVKPRRLICYNNRTGW